MKVEIRTAKPEELSSVQLLLQLVELPIEGIKDHFSDFLIALSEDLNSLLIGCVGLECYGVSALLRSLAIHSDFQNRGLGTALVEAITTQAKKKGIRQLFLLTDSAEAFFRRFGFKKIKRAQVPYEVKQSIEFTSLCTKATAMAKNI
ncbi:MAG: arsenic resistance N-acetyltransferase ArsN2 [Candidatus Thorarchaeota archaeon]